MAARTEQAYYRFLNTAVGVDVASTTATTVPVPVPVAVSQPRHTIAPHQGTEAETPPVASSPSPSSLSPWTTNKDSSEGPSGGDALNLDALALALALPPRVPQTQGDTQSLPETPEGLRGLKNMAVAPRAPTIIAGASASVGDSDDDGGGEGDGGGAHTSHAAQTTLTTHTTHTAEKAHTAPTAQTVAQTATQTVTSLATHRLASLAQHEKEAVSAALRPPHDDTVVVSKFSVDITRRLLQSLQPQTWLNDEVVNFHMSMLAERDDALAAAAAAASSGSSSPSKASGAPDYTTDSSSSSNSSCGNGRRRSHFFNSFFTDRLQDSGHNTQYCYSNVRRWSRKFDVFALDKLVCPVNINSMHWALAVVYVQQVRYEHSIIG